MNAPEPVRVLVVDDTAANRLALEAMLDDLDVEVVTADSGETALRRVLENDFAVILLDVQMPGMDGFETAMHIRQRERSRDTPIIFVTAIGREEVQVFRGYSVGAVDYLFKPVVPEIMRGKVSVFADLYRKRVEIQRQMALLRELEAREHRMRLEEAKREADRTLLEVERKARVEAEAASRAKDEFLATLSHELRTPLQAILGWARMLRTGQLDEATSARALETLERNADAQARLVEDLLDVSRIITGRLRCDVVPTRLGSVVETAIDSARPAADAKEIRLEYEARTGSDLVSGDPQRLQQVIWNLVSNAVKFTPSGGHVRISLERADDNLEVRVSDSGVGINPEFLPYVFDRFRQADGTPSRAYGGLGLGLAIVRHLIELHGGTVRAASDGEGRGATFTVTLPVARRRREELLAGEPNAGLEPAFEEPVEPDLRARRAPVLDDDVGCT